MNEAYWRDRYRKQGPTYVAKGGKPQSFRAQIAALTPYLRDLPGGDRVLDFGCGPQRFRSILEQAYGEYVGVDLIRELATHDHGEVEEASCDAAIAVFVLQHIPGDEDYRGAVRYIHERLRDGGVLLAVEHAGGNSMLGHMHPRGIEGLLAVADWSGCDILGEYDGHAILRLTKGPPSPDLKPTKRAPAVVVRHRTELERPEIGVLLGGADCVWQDWEALQAIVGDWPGAVIAVNDIGVHYPGRLDHWTSLHTEKLPAWERERLGRGHDKTWLVWGRQKKQRVRLDRVIEGWASGSSGLLGIGVALAAGCRRIVLCGVPMEKRPHFAESTVHQPTKPWNAAPAHFRAWTRNGLDVTLRQHVRSMSGRTRELLGYPTREWTLGEEEA